jgi:hypothetical protein
MEKQYRLSWYEKKEYFKIKYFKWWQFWKKPIMVKTDNWNRESLILNLTDNEIEDLKNNLDCHIISVLKYRNVKNIQLEL